MTRVCTICAHPNRAEIEGAIIRSEPYRRIASRFETSTTSLQRHLPHVIQTLTKAKEAREAARADDLLQQLKALRNKAIGLLTKAEAAGDYRTALAGVREARGCLELLAEMEGELNRNPQINILVAPEWLTVRAAVIEALQPFPAARVAVAERLLQLKDGVPS
jgi:hypothetical protein